MKRILCLLAILTACATWTLTGCSKSDGGPAIDTAKVESAFAAVKQADKAELQNALTAIKAGNYKDALTSLQKAAAGVKLTPEQQQSLKDLMAQVQAKLSGAAKEAVDSATKAVKGGADKAASEAGKAASDLQKATGK
jgi:hypothetical protein